MKREFILSLFLIGNVICFAQNIIKYEYDERGNVLSRKSEKAETVSQCSNKGYTARILTNPTKGPLKIEVKDKNGKVSCILGIILTNMITGLRYDDSQVYYDGEINFDMSDCPDGVYIATIYVDVNSRFPTIIQGLKIIKRR